MLCKCSDKPLAVRHKMINPITPTRVAGDRQNEANEYVSFNTCNATNSIIISFVSFYSSRWVGSKTYSRENPFVVSVHTNSNYGTEVAQQREDPTQDIVVSMAIAQSW